MTCRSEALKWKTLIVYQVWLPIDCVRNFMCCPSMQLRASHSRKESIFNFSKFKVYIREQKPIQVTNHISIQQNEETKATTPPLLTEDSNHISTQTSNSTKHQCPLQTHEFPKTSNLLFCTNVHRQCSQLVGPSQQKAQT